MTQPAPGAGLASWLHLVLTPGIGPVAVARLLAGFGLPEQVLQASHSALAGVVGAHLARALLQSDPAREASLQAALRWAAQPGCHLIALDDPRYPPRLLHLPDPPPLLWVRGRVELLQAPSLAIVGSRSAGAGGQATAQAFAQALAGHGLTIVSGLARGIDAAAHRGALGIAASTLAVLGTGADRVYPQSQRALAQAIQADGALVSELPPPVGPSRAAFPRRNRLIAGLSLGVLVVEAALNSGSLITARLAAELGREVCAIPGSIHSPTARGCHRLIQEGAQLVESVQDILTLLPPWCARAPGSHPTAPPPGGQARGAAALAAAGAEPRAARVAPSVPSGLHPDDPDQPSAAEQALLAAIGWDPLHPDHLLARAQSALAGEGRALGVPELLAGLAGLELRGWLERLPDGRCQRLPPQAAVTRFDTPWPSASSG